MAEGETRQWVQVRVRKRVHDLLARVRDRLESVATRVDGVGLAKDRPSLSDAIEYLMKRRRRKGRRPSKKEGKNNDQG